MINLGEKYLDKFVSINNEPFYDFNEFSYFGKDNVWEPLERNDLYNRLLDALFWVRTFLPQISESESYTPLKNPNLDSSPTIYAPEISPEIPSETHPSVSTESTVPEYAPEPVSSETYIPRVPEQTPELVPAKSNSEITNIGNFNITKAIERLHYLTQFDLKDRYDTSKWVKKDRYRSASWCARAVSLAMEAGGLKTNWRPKYAGLYGSGLLKNGWKQLSDNITTFLPGDICVIKGLGTKGRGHICMFDGKRWVSDFYLNSWDVYRGKAKRGINTHFYRYRG